MTYALPVGLMIAAFWTLYEARHLPPSQFYWIWMVALGLAVLAGVSLHAA